MGTPRKQNLLGQRFGRWTVIAEANTRNNIAYWLCRCDCGVEREVAAKGLKSGRSTSCGCGRSDKLKELTIKNLVGQTFGRLTVLEDSGERYDKNVIWVCQCECGAIVKVPGKSLTTGNTRSCGCLMRDTVSENQKKDLSNQRFGALTAIRPTAERQERCVVWECLCDCGKKYKVNTHNLLRGKVSSCGCLSMSKGEFTILNLLEDANISFVREASFDTCRFADTNKLARFDFYVNNTYLIEFDGEQHFRSSASGWNDEEYLKKTQQHDAFKNNWCKENNIPLIRIPYTHLNNLCIDDLLLETSRFIVK